MKKVLIGLILVLAVIGAIVFVVFNLTRGATRSADEFFTLVRDGKAREAYRSASREFQASSSEADFEAFLKNSTIADYDSAAWSSRSVSNNISELEGSIKTRAGGIVPVKIKLIKEDGRWKIHAIEKAAAGLVETPAEKRTEAATPEGPAVPPEEELKSLAKASSLLLARAVNTGDFSELYAAAAKLWQSQITPEALRESFKTLIDQKVDLMFVEGQSPTFRERPSIGEHGELVLQGAFPGLTSPLNFIFRYVRQDGEWKLVGINISSDETPGGATRGAAKAEIPPEGQLIDLTNRAMALLARAVDRDDFSDLYASIAKLWQQQISKEALRDRLSVFIEKKISLTVIEGVSPVFSEKPYFDSDGLLVLKGRYPSKPYEVVFELDFFNEESAWKLFGLNVVTKTPE